MFIIWVFIIAIVAVLVIYLVSKKSCCCRTGGEKELPGKEAAAESKPETPAAPRPPYGQ